MSVHYYFLFQVVSAATKFKPNFVAPHSLSKAVLITASALPFCFVSSTFSSTFSSSPSRLHAHRHFSTSFSLLFFPLPSSPSVPLLPGCIRRLQFPSDIRLVFVPVVSLSVGVRSEHVDGSCPCSLPRSCPLTCPLPSVPSLPPTHQPGPLNLSVVWFGPDRSLANSAAVLPSHLKPASIPLASLRAWAVAPSPALSSPSHRLNSRSAVRWRRCRMTHPPLLACTHLPSYFFPVSSHVSFAHFRAFSPFPSSVLHFLSSSSSSYLVTLGTFVSCGTCSA